MKKLFPNIETLIILVFVVCVMLWGVTRCNRNKDNLTAKAAIESNANNSVDTSGLSSPAARNSGTKPVTPAISTVNAPPPLPNDPNAVVVNQQQVPAPVVQSPSTVQNNQTQTQVHLPAATTTTVAPNVTTVPAQPAGTSLYVLINGLNVRTKPDLKAKSLGKLKIHDQVYFMNEVTPEAQTVRLIDKSEVTKPWFKIKTKKGTIGWVHGSGVDFYKRKPQGVN